MSSPMTNVTQISLDETGGLNRRRIHLREISDEADAPLETVGQDLRAARLRRGDDLATVSKALKIRKDHLEALEEDRFDSLPGRTYAVGFIRSYAEYLGLDPVQCVSRFKAEVEGRSAEPAQPVFSEPPEESRLPQGWIIMAVVVLAFIIYGAFYLLNSADSLLDKPVDPVPSRIAANVPKPEPAPPPVNAANQAGPPAQGITIGNDGIFGDSPGQLATDPGASATPADGQTPDQQVASVAPEEPAIPQGTVYGKLNRNSRLTLRAVQPTHILVEGRDGTIYINRTLQAGDTYLVPDMVGLELTTPNAGAVELIMDGQAMGHAGLPRQIMESLSLDPQDVVDRYNRGRAG